MRLKSTGESVKKANRPGRTLWFMAILSVSGAVSMLAATRMPDSGQLGELARVRVPFVENRGQLDHRVAFSAPTFFGTVFVTRDGKLVYSLPPAREVPADGQAARPVQALDPDRDTRFGKTRASRRTPLGYRRQLLPRQRRPTLAEQPADIRRGPPRRSLARRLRLAPRSWRQRREDLHAATGCSESRRSGSASAARRLSGSTGKDRSWPGRATATSASPRLSPIRSTTARASRSPSPTSSPGNATASGWEATIRTLPVVVDPVLQSTYLGGSSDDLIEAMTVHPTSGEVIVTGWTDHYSADFPGTTGGAQPAFGGGFTDGFVARLNSTLTTLLQATYVGGNDEDTPKCLTIAPSGDVLVAGHNVFDRLPGHGSRHATHIRSRFLRFRYPPGFDAEPRFCSQPTWGSEPTASRRSPSIRRAATSLSSGRRLRPIFPARPAVRSRRRTASRSMDSSLGSTRP